MPASPLLFKRPATRILNKHRRLVLKLLRKLRTDPCDPLLDRKKLADMIHLANEGGYIAVVHGGRDCDMAQWDNNVTVLPANTLKVERWIENLYEWADGPRWWRITTLSEAASLRASSRDLALEAFEDGHPHVVYA